MISATCVFSGSRRLATTRTTTSRSEMIPTSLPLSWSTTSAPMPSAIIVSQASRTVACGAMETARLANWLSSMTKSPPFRAPADLVTSAVYRAGFLKYSDGNDAERPTRSGRGATALRAEACSRRKLPTALDAKSRSRRRQRLLGRRAALRAEFRARRQRRLAIPTSHGSAHRLRLDIEPAHLIDFARLVASLLHRDVRL